MNTNTQSWMLEWSYGRAEVQALGAMLGPVDFRLPSGQRFQPMYVAPWPDDPALPPLLRCLRGEWPCVPFGRCDVPAGLPAGWRQTAPDDTWLHGIGSNVPWQLVSHAPDRLVLAIDYPEPSPVRRLVREIVAEADAPVLAVSLTIESRADAVLPVALHPTFRLPAEVGGVEVAVGGYRAVASYPTTFEPGASGVAPDRISERLNAVQGLAGAIDLSRLPLGRATEELVQLLDCDGHVTLRYRNEGAQVTLAWDHALLPDCVLWVSNRGRLHAPWLGRNLALGVEPVNGVFELGRVAAPPAGHPMAGRTGLALHADHHTVIRYTLSAAALDAGT